MREFELLFKFLILKFANLNYGKNRVATNIILNRIKFSSFVSAVHNGVIV